MSELPRIPAIAKEIVKNKRTGKVYDSKSAFDADVADPNTDRNTHHIEAVGKSGKMTFTIENTPDPQNPKTSRLAILSAIETLRQYCSDDIQIGT